MQRNITENVYFLARVKKSVHQRVKGGGTNHFLSNYIKKKTPFVFTGRFYICTKDVATISTTPGVLHYALKWYINYKL